MRDELLKLLKLHSVKRGKFTLASGRTSDFYVDCKRTMLQPEALVLYSELLVDVFKTMPPAVAGVALGGVPLATGFAVWCKAGAKAWLYRSPDIVLVRPKLKDHGTTNLVERPATLADGAHCVLLEDVVTTGGSSMCAVTALRADGLVCDRCVCIVDREEGGRELLECNGVRFDALFTRADFPLTDTRTV